MNIIWVSNYTNKDFDELENYLKEEDIILKSCEDESEDIKDNCLCLYNIDTIQQLSSLKPKSHFAIISSINDPQIISQSMKIGALDYIYKPFTDAELTAKRIRRIFDLSQMPSQKLNNADKKADKIVETEIKRAHRGKYELCVLNLIFEYDIALTKREKLINKIKSILRDSDTPMWKNDGSILITLPFTDSSGVEVVTRKIINLLFEEKEKGYCLGAVYPKDGTELEQILKSLGNSIDSRRIYI